MAGRRKVSWRRCRPAYERHPKSMSPSNSPSKRDGSIPNLVSMSPSCSMSTIVGQFLIGPVVVVAVALAHELDDPFSWNLQCRLSPSNPRPIPAGLVNSQPSSSSRTPKRPRHGSPIAAASESAGSALARLRKTIDKMRPIATTRRTQIHQWVPLLRPVERAAVLRGELTEGR